MQVLPLLYRYGGERDLNEVLASNTKASSNGENFDDFFKDTARTPISNNGSFLNNILKSIHHPTQKRPKARAH